MMTIIFCVNELAKLRIHTTFSKVFLGINADRLLMPSGIAYWFFDIELKLTGLSPWAHL